MRVFLSTVILLAAAVPIYAQPTSIPEPGTLPLLAIGVAAALYIARRVKK